MGKAEKKDPTLTLAELAHELRQPLTGIRTSAELLVNLLRNALEAMAGKRGRIRVSAAPLAGAVEVIVEDDGPGVRDDLRPRLFSPFTTGRAAGAGLGLHISRSLAEEAGGALDL